jgi:hypothetical protein
MTQPPVANRYLPLPGRTSSALPTTEMGAIPLSSLLLRKNQASPAALAVRTAGGPAASRCRNFFVEPRGHLDGKHTMAHSIDGSISTRVPSRALQRSSGRPLGHQPLHYCEVTL